MVRWKNKYFKIKNATQDLVDENGNPVGGYTSDAIRKLIGQKVDSSVGAEFGRTGWTGSLGVTRYISDLDEAMAVYADLMKNMHGRDIPQ